MYERLHIVYNIRKYNECIHYITLIIIHCTKNVHNKNNDQIVCCFENRKFIVLLVSENQLALFISKIIIINICKKNDSSLLNNATDKIYIQVQSRHQGTYFSTMFQVYQVYMFEYKSLCTIMYGWVYITLSHLFYVLQMVLHSALLYTLCSYVYRAVSIFYP